MVVASLNPIGDTAVQIIDKHLDEFGKRVHDQEVTLRVISTNPDVELGHNVLLCDNLTFCDGTSIQELASKLAASAPARVRQ